MTARLSMSLVAAMLSVAVTTAQNTAAPSGIFLIGPGGTSKQIPAVSSLDAQTSGIAKSILKPGAGASWNARYAGATATFVVTDPQPVFLFRFIDNSQFSKSERANADATLAAARASGGGLLPGVDAKDYTLAKMAVDGDSRVVSSKDRVTVTTQKKAPREFEVRVAAPLEPGEYAFFFGLTGAPKQIFPFTVKR